jgi:hypothetical protein
MISSRHLRYRYQIFQNFKPVAIVAVPIDERKKLGGGSEQQHALHSRGLPVPVRVSSRLLPLGQITINPPASPREGEGKANLMRT